MQPSTSATVAAALDEFTRVRIDDLPQQQLDDTWRFVADDFPRAARRSDVAGGPEDVVSMDIDATFVARLCALFGPPEQLRDGVRYFVRHAPSNIAFGIYVTGERGAGYHAAPPDIVRDESGNQSPSPRLREALERFEARLRDARTDDCEAVLVSDEGKFRMGFRDGQPLVRPLDANECAEHFRHVGAPASDSSLACAGL